MTGIAYTTGTYLLTIRQEGGTPPPVNLTVGSTITPLQPSDLQGDRWLFDVTISGAEGTTVTLTCNTLGTGAQQCRFIGTL